MAKVMMDAIAIQSADDPRIEPYRRVRERDVVGRDGGFIIEGEVVLRAFAAAGRHNLMSVLLAEHRVEKLAPVVAQLPFAPVFCAPQAVLDQIVGFHIHRGVLAFGRRAPSPTPEVLLNALEPRAVVLVLFGIGNHDNMGALFRNAAAFGAGAVLLDSTCCDPLYRKSIRVSVGAALTVPFAWMARGVEPVALLAAHGFEVLALSPNGAFKLADLKPAPRTALLLGAEGPGLPADILKSATTVAIPMAGLLDSLNVATSSGIALHHLIFAT